MRDSLDLNSLATRIHNERRKSALSWWIYGAFVAGLIVLSLLIYTAAATSSDPCRINQFCRIFSAATVIVPALAALGYIVVALNNWQQRRLSVKQSLVELSSLELPPPIHSQKSSTGILITILLVIMIVIPILLQLNIVVILFEVCLIAAIIVYGNRWLYSPLASANYPEVLRRVNAYHQWFPNGALSVKSAAEIMGGYQESEQTNRQFLAQMIQSNTFEAWALNNLASELIFQQRYEEALPLLENAVRMNPHLAVSYESLATWYLFQNLDPQRALELAQFSFRLPIPRVAIYKNASIAMKLATRAWAEARTGLAKQSEATITQALKKASPKNIPYYASLLFTLGQVKIALNDLSTAYSYFSQAAQIDPQGRFGKMSADHLTRFNHPT